LLGPCPSLLGSLAIGPRPAFLLGPGPLLAIGPSPAFLLGPSPAFLLGPCPSLLGSLAIGPRPAFLLGARPLLALGARSLLAFGPRPLLALDPSPALLLGVLAFGLLPFGVLVWFSLGVCRPHVLGPFARTLPLAFGMPLRDMWPLGVVNAGSMPCSVRRSIVLVVPSMPQGMMVAAGAALMQPTRAMPVIFGAVVQGRARGGISDRGSGSAARRDGCYRQGANQAQGSDSHQSRPPRAKSRRQARGVHQRPVGPMSKAIDAMRQPRYGGGATENVGQLACWRP
jgi:hypothetical protein